MRLCTILFLFVISSTIGIQSQSYYWEYKFSCNILGGPIEIEKYNIANVYFGSNDSIYRSTDFGNQFLHFGSIVPESKIVIKVIIDNENPSTLIVASEGFGSLTDKLFKSTNSGDSWTLVYERLKSTFLYILMTQDPAHPDTIYATSDGIFIRSTDFGSSWDTLTTSVPTYTACDVEVFPDTSIILIGSRDTGIFKSSDYGYSWWQVYSTANETPFFAIDFSEPGVVWATQFGVMGGLLKSSDYGETWQTVPFFNNLDTWGISINPENPAYIYVGELDGNIFLSQDGGSSWIATEIPPLGVTFQIYAADTMNVYAMQNHALFKLNSPFFVTDVSESNNNLIQHYILKQNYPNPFNPRTTINYQIPELSFVTLKVYDVLGSEVATIVNEEKPSGSYTIDFDARGLSNGIYFYKIHAGTFVEIKKMILLK